MSDYTIETPKFTFNFPISEDLLGRLLEDANGKKWLGRKLRSLLFLNHTKHEIVSGVYHLLNTSLGAMVNQPNPKWSLPEFQAELENSLLAARESCALSETFSSEPEAKFKSATLYKVAVFFATWITANSHDLLLTSGYLKCTPTSIQYVPYTFQ